MNLGDIYLRAAATICIASSVLVLVAMLLVRRLRRSSWPALLALAIPSFLLFTWCGLYFGHQPLFAAWHRVQNHILPRSGCLTYKPTFARLCASYRMTRPEFDAWVQAHPWGLVAVSASDVHQGDLQQLGVAKPDAAFATKSAPNGRQLRVYYRNKVMYVVYYAM